MDSCSTNFDVNNTIFTDICSKSNKKIQYKKLQGDLDPVKAVKSSITSWNTLQYFHSIIKDIFLPKGYPNSVSSDYLEYQIWDTCQAFCSSISGTLAMQAVMEGIGVGSENTKPISAAITWIMKDGTGMLGSIMFAWIKGSKFDSDCKKWRLFADIINDIAMFIELYIPKVINFSMHMLCLATVLKALVGTAGGSTRAALITHQAVKGNIADVSAKDGSQELCTNLFAFMFGIFILKNVTETEQIWTVMCTAVFFHLVFNYKAVRCLQMNVFNSERFRLSLRAYLPTSSVPTIEQVNRNETVFLGRGTSDFKLCGFTIVFGRILKRIRKNSPIFRLKSHLDESVALNPDNVINDGNNALLMKAYMSCEDFIEKEFTAFRNACKEEGWNIESHLIVVNEWRGDWKYTPSPTKTETIPKVKNTKPTRQGYERNAPVKDDKKPKKAFQGNYSSLMIM